MKIIMQLVTWNSATHLSALFASLRQLDIPAGMEISLRVQDNASSDNSVAVLKSELATLSFAHELIVLETNTGFAGGHNRLFAAGQGADYVFLLNPDLVLSADCLGRMASYLEAHPHTAVVAPRLMRQHTETIDALGLEVYRNRQVVDGAAGQSLGEYKPSRSIMEVFGVSGACVLGRVSALQSVVFADGTLFDESYFMYKEDVDLAYRLQSAGWTATIMYDVVVYHARGTKSIGVSSDLAAAKQKKIQSAQVRYLSYKNHLLTLYKNEYWQNLLLDFPWIVWYEGKKLVYQLFFDTGTLRAIFSIWQECKAVRAKRAWIVSKRRVDWRTMRRHWQTTLHDESYGAVVAARQGNEWQYLIVQQQDGVWQFPKGHADPGETPTVAALRELREESGLTPERVLKHPWLTIGYTFQSGTKKIRKRVSYLLALGKREDVQIDGEEIVDSVWLPYRAACDRLSFATHRRVLMQAHNVFEKIV